MKKAIIVTLKWLMVFIKSALVVCLFLGSYNFLNKIFYNREADRNVSFHSLPEDSIDVLVLGSSHAFYSFMPTTFFEDTGLYSYMLGSMCQPLEVSLQMLKDALKTQSPQMVILEVFTALPLRSICYADSCYVVPSYMVSGQERLNILSYLDQEKRENYENDFLIYHNDWKNIDSLDYFDTSNFSDAKGEVSNTFGSILQEPLYYEYDNCWTPVQYESDSSVELRESDIKALNEIKQTCDENNIILYLYKTPIDGMTEENAGALDKVWRWAEENNVAYSDFYRESEELEFYMNIHSDAFHCYYHGATFLTDLLAERISVYNLSHEGDSELDDKYIQTAKDLTNKVISYEDDPYKILKRLKNANGYSFIYFKEGLSEEKVIGQMKELDSEYSGGNYLAIFKDGKLLISGEEIIETEIAGKNISFNASEIKIDQEVYELSGDFSFTYSYDLSEFNIFTGDYKGRAWREGFGNYYHWVYKG